MTIETEVANLTTQTTALLNAVNVSKATLDQKVTDATAQAGIATTKAAEAGTSAATATTKANAAAAASAAAVTAQNNAVAVVTGGTGSLAAAPGKLPLADAEGKLDASWFTSILPLFGPLMPQILFGYSEPGALYDPSDMSTLFQDAAGTTPVTAMEQPVGRMLDLSGNGNHASQATTTKRGVVSRRVNLLTKTEQFGNAVWTKKKTGTGVTPVVTENAALAPNGANTASQVTFDLGAGVSGSDLSLIAQSITVGSENYIGGIWVRTDSGTKKIVFRHASTGAFLESTVTPDWQYIVRTEAGFAGTGDRFEIGMRGSSESGSATLFIWGASLTLATDAHLPYQRVNTATDYDADPAKFPAYLRFDGVDDAYQTNSIDFTGTDKMTVWAGVDRLPGYPTGFIVESSASSFTNNGAFALLAHSTLGYEFSSRGTVLTDTTFNSSPPATPSIVAASFDIGGGSVVRRVNSQQSAIAANQGTGQYGNYPLYIGARAAVGTYFNGRLYSLIVRGAATPLAQIEATELYIKQKMRLP